MAKSISLRKVTTNLEDMIKNGQVTELKKQLHFGRISKTWYEASVRRNLLHLAASFNQVEIVNFLVSECKFNINAQDNEGNTALHLAVIGGHLEATGAILSHKPNDSLCNKEGKPPFHVAIQQGERGVEIVSEFVQHPTVDVFVTGHDAYSSLHAAAESNNLKALELIYKQSLQYQENVFCRILMKMHKKFSAFHLAARAGSHDALAFMLSKCDDCTLSVNLLSGENKTSLHYAVERGHAQCVRVLLEHGGDPMVISGYHPQPIHLACMLGRVDVLRLMVDMCGKKILQSHDCEGGTALHNSTTSLNSVDLISYLVANGVGVNEVNSNSFSPLSLAIQHGSVHAIEELLRQGADPLIKDKLGYTALHRAVVSERMEIFKKIADSDVVHVMATSADACGYFPIHHALKLGHHEMVVSLFSVTSEVFNEPDGNNYLHLAATFCEEHTFLKLINIDLSQYMLNEANSSGLTPLHCAAAGSSINIVKNLLNHGAVINKDNDGKTPFMHACSSGSLAVAKLLYKGNEYQRDWVDNNGCTALHLAVDGKSPDVISFCLDTGMAITLNDDEVSFFDRILDLGYENLGRAAVSHKRWEECIDICSPYLPHPILRILDKMPGIYRSILDQCYTKSDLSPTHRDYWEESNFKCLNLGLKNSAEDYVPVEAGTVVNSNKHIYGANSKRKRFSAKRNEGSFEVISKLIECGLVSYAQHPIIREYIKLKWKGIGRPIRWTVWLAPLLLALLLSIPLSITDLPESNSSVASSDTQSENITDELSANQTDNSTTVESLASDLTRDILLFTFSFVLALANLLLVVLEIYTHGFQLLLKFTLSLPIWSHLTASLSTFVFDFGFLVSRGSLSDDNLFVAAAVGVLAAWFSVGFNLQLIYYLNVGAYVTMVIGTIRLIFIVLATLFFFFLGFAYSFHILVGNVAGLQYGTVGRSLFSTFHSLIATTDVIEFINLEEAGELQFHVYVFILLALLIILLPILFTNLLIGLTIGDISQIRKDAIISRLSIEMHAIVSLDVKCIPRSCNVDVNKKYHRRYPNRTSCISVVGKIINNWFTSKSRLSDAAEDTNSAINVLQEATREFSEFKECQNRNFNRLHHQINQLASAETAQLSKMKQLEEKFEANIKRLENILEQK